MEHVLTIVHACNMGLIGIVYRMIKVLTVVHNPVVALYRAKIKMNVLKAVAQNGNGRP